MKIRHPFVLKLIGFVGAIIIRLYMSTIRFFYRGVGMNLHPGEPGFQGRYIYIFWHENILLPCLYCARRDVRVLISQHADGEMIAQVCRHVGFGTIRGSTTRGGVQAMRKMVRASKNCHISIIPDGPRGPRRHVEKGVVFLASKTRLPIVVVGVGYDRPWRLPTWDRFAIPKPWSKAYLVTLPPIEIPATLGKDQLETYTQFVQEKLEYVTGVAENLASR